MRTIAASPSQPELLAKVNALMQSQSQAQAQRKGLALSIHTEDEVAYKVALDVMRVRQGLFNLVPNTIKFAEHRRVAMQVRQDEKDGAPMLLFARLMRG